MQKSRETFFIPRSHVLQSNFHVTQKLNPIKDDVRRSNTFLLNFKVRLVKNDAEVKIEFSAGFSLGKFRRVVCFQLNKGRSQLKLTWLSLTFPPAQIVAQVVENLMLEEKILLNCKCLRLCKHRSFLASMQGRSQG